MTWFVSCSYFIVVGIVAVCGMLLLLFDVDCRRVRCRPLSLQVGSAAGGVDVVCVELRMVGCIRCANNFPSNSECMG